MGWQRLRNCVSRRHFFSNQFADRNFSAERFLAFSHLIGGLALVATAFVTSFPAFFALFLVYGLLYVPTISVANSLAFANLKNPAEDFGFVRMGGTVGWIVVSWPFIFLLGDKAGPAETRLGLHRRGSAFVRPRRV